MVEQGRRAEAGHGLRVPVLELEIDTPSRGSAAYYGALGALAALEIIEWPLALVVAAGHAIATNTSDPEVAEAAKGLESAA